MRTRSSPCSEAQFQCTVAQTTCSATLASSVPTAKPSWTWTCRSSTRSSSTDEKQASRKGRYSHRRCQWIGEATARHFADNGARAVVIADIQDDEGRNVAASIGPDRCAYIHCDVTDGDQVKSLVESTVSLYGRLDVMFSNAGIVSRKSQTVLDMDLSLFDELIAVNTRGMEACVKHAARAMKEGGVRGSIICTASVLASRGFDVGTDYAMSKHAVLGLMRSASLQLAGDGIRVNSV
ncbi:hypothetical protein FNV43_RR20474 [Rhamnella rubrinervis]|uniref:SDR family oxidoreductase n=1 Tax=Rhamnella rubrinervis TaxID=2594499 RepID=A0A8K0E0F8_9ROSA|nr:hypothetical protein FNV43_RR20474 [Rhamnella rubrinervis]